MAIQIGAKPDSGFDDPLGMLKDCHRRIERFLDILCTVVERASSRALTAEEKSAVESALQYFRTGGERHTADEEESLFPRLRAAIPASELAGIDQLEHDHDEAGHRHAEIDRLYSRWIATGALSPESGKSLLSLTETLRHLYAAHIEVEESVVFPRAAQALNRESIAAIGEEFRNRRQ